VFFIHIYLPTLLPFAILRKNLQKRLIDIVPSDRKGPLFMVAASLCWSLGGLCIKFIPWNAMSIIGMRAALAAVVFAIYRRSVKVKFTRGNVLAAFCIASTTILFVFANQLTTAAAAILLQFSAPIFILLMQLIFYRKKPKFNEILAVSITIFGMLLFFADKLETGYRLGNIIAIMSGVTFAGVFVCNKRPDTDPSQSVMLGFLINSAVGLPFIFFDANIVAAPSAWSFMLLLGIVQVGFAYIFFTEGIKRTAALLACLITALEPVLNPIWVAIFTDERPGRFALAGGAVIFVTVVCYNVWLEKQKKTD